MGASYLKINNRRIIIKLLTRMTVYQQGKSNRPATKGGQGAKPPLATVLPP